MFIQQSAKANMERAELLVELERLSKNSNRETDPSPTRNYSKFWDFISIPVYSLSVLLFLYGCFSFYNDFTDQVRRVQENYLSYQGEQTIIANSTIINAQEWQDLKDRFDFTGIDGEDKIDVEVTYDVKIQGIKYISFITNSEGLNKIREAVGSKNLFIKTFSDKRIILYFCIKD
jgi:hypothetical protein